MRVEKKEKHTRWENGIEWEERVERAFGVPMDTLVPRQERQGERGKHEEEAHPCSAEVRLMK